MGKPKAPKPPDPRETAAAQTGMNIDTAVANNAMGMVNQVTPDGSITYDVTGHHDWTDPTTGRYYRIPTYTATTSLSPEGEQIRDLNNQAQINLAQLGANQSARADELLGQSFTPNDAMVGIPDRRNIGLPDYDAFQTDYEDDFSDHKERTFNAINDRLQIGFDEDRDRLRTELLNSGIREGTEAYDREMRNHSDRVTRGRTDAYLASGQEQSRLIGLARDEAAFGNDATARNNMVSAQRYRDELGRADAIENQQARELQRDYAARNQSLNEIAALLSGSQVATPQFNVAQSAGIPTTDFAGLEQQNYSNELARYEQQMAPYNAAIGGLFGLGSSYLIGGGSLPFGGGAGAGAGATGGGFGGAFGRAVYQPTGFSFGG